MPMKIGVMKPPALDPLIVRKSPGCARQEPNVTRSRAEWLCYRRAIRWSSISSYRDTATYRSCIVALASGWA
jgi:hypothetical protein